MIMKIAGIALISVFLVLVLKQIKPEFAFVAQLGCGIMIISAVLPDVVSIVKSLYGMTELQDGYSALPSLLVKIAAAALIFQFLSELCRDFGQGALASNVEFAGKAVGLTMALPILEGLIGLVEGLVNSV